MAGNRKVVKLIAAAFLCAAILCVSAVAQSSPPSPPLPPQLSPPPLPEELRATSAQIATLFEVMRLKEQMASVLDLMPVMALQIVQKQRESLNVGQLTPKQQEKIEGLLKQYIEKSMNLYPVEEIIADARTVYQKYIRRDDADVLIEFYRTPAMQRMMHFQPVISQEYLPLVLSRISIVPS